MYIFSKFFIWRIAKFFDSLWKTYQWYIVTTSDNEWQQVVQQVVQLVATSDNEWDDNKWVTMSSHFG